MLHPRNKGGRRFRGFRSTLLKLLLRTCEPICSQSIYQCANKVCTTFTSSKLPVDISRNNFCAISRVLYQDEETVCRSNKLSSALRTSLFRDGSFHCVLMVSSLGSYWKKANHQVSGLMFRMGGTILSMLFYHLGPYETFMRFEPVSVIC